MAPVQQVAVAPAGAAVDDQKVAGTGPLSLYKVPVEDTTFGVDDKDKDTPDKWVERHPSLIRLTGRHPFNCEPPLSKLRDLGFLTPASLHYVRNHGYVPKTDWDTWSVEIGGLVWQPKTLKMVDIVAMKSQTIPVTLVCAGNRRKEQNMVKQTIGFNWGAAGVSTSLWTGVRLCDILLQCGIRTAQEGALYVCFEGEETLPKAGGTKYATSISRTVALDPACDVMLVYAQNGEKLTPDHGYPLRMIIPGYIGGRMVKWLKKITVTQVESDNHYHYNDNRVLPTMIDAETATRDGWWYKPDYIINQLNVNSAMYCPGHGELLPLSSASGVFTARGYAYAGGGRKVTRVELTLDNGTSWRLADIIREEQPTEHGKYWCWVHWRLDIDMVDLMNAKEMAVRAWDESLSTQPENLIWNVMGMMNNCWFRTRIALTSDPATNLPSLRFTHPTLPAGEAGGWMVKQVEPEPPVVPPPSADVKSTASEAVAAAAVSAVAKIDATAVVPKKGFTMAEVQKHDSEKSSWIVVKGKVYDATPYLEAHPGGKDSITMNAGEDASDEFEGIHSKKAWKLLEKYYIGELLTEEEAAAAAATGAAVVPAPPPAAVEPGAAFAPIPVAEKAAVQQEAVGLQALVRGMSEVTVANGVSAVEKPVTPPPTEVKTTLQENEHLKTLHPKKYLALPLTEKIILSHDTRLFRFSLPTPEHILGLPTGKHMFLAATINEKKVLRAYTPTSMDDDIGHVDLVVKVYFRGVVPRFPDGGMMSQHLESLKIGDTIDVKGPIGHIEYKGWGVLASHGVEKRVRKIAMIAGGTGITPMYQVAKHILKETAHTMKLGGGGVMPGSNLKNGYINGITANGRLNGYQTPADASPVVQVAGAKDAGGESPVIAPSTVPIQLSLIYANRTVDDILLRSDIDEWDRTYPTFSAWYTVDLLENCKEDWKYAVGRISPEMFKEHLFEGGEDTVAMVCGPPGFVAGSVSILEGLGYKTEDILKF